MFQLNNLGAITETCSARCFHANERRGTLSCSELVTHGNKSPSLAQPSGRDARFI